MVGVRYNMVQPEQKFRKGQVTATIWSKEVEGKKGKFTHTT